MAPSNLMTYREWSDYEANRQRIIVANRRLKTTFKMVVPLRLPVPTVTMIYDENNDFVGKLLDGQNVRDIPDGYTYKMEKAKF